MKALIDPALVEGHIETYLTVHDGKFGESFRMVINRVADEGRELDLDVFDNGPAVLIEDNGSTLTVTVWGDPRLSGE